MYFFWAYKDRLTTNQSIHWFVKLVYQTASTSTPVPPSIPASNPAFQQSPAVPRWKGADFKIFKNRLPKLGNGMSPSRLECPASSSIHEIAVLSEHPAFSTLQQNNGALPKTEWT